MKCYTHADMEAVDACTVCGRMVCPDCRMDYEGKGICKPCALRLARVFTSLSPYNISRWDSDPR